MILKIIFILKTVFGGDAAMKKFLITVGTIILGTLTIFSQTKIAHVTVPQKQAMWLDKAYVRGIEATKTDSLGEIIAKIYYPSNRNKDIIVKMIFYEQKVPCGNLYLAKIRGVWQAGIFYNSNDSIITVQKTLCLLERLY